MVSKSNERVAVELFDILSDQWVEMIFSFSFSAYHIP